VVLARGNGIDTIYNYAVGSTRLSLGGGLTFSNLTVAQSGSNTLIRAGSESLALLFGIDASTVTAASFL
jgi:hypothetical protein